MVNLLTAKLLMLKTLRDLFTSARAYLVCISIITVGFAGYCMLSILSEQLENSQRAFYENTSFADVFAEIHEAPLSVTKSLEKVPGVEKACGRIVKTLRTSEKSANPPELKFISYTEDGLNLPLLSRGLLPLEGNNALVVGDGFFDAREMKIGDNLEMLVDGRKVSFTVDGSGLSPENIYMIKSITDMLPTPAQYDAAFLPYKTMEKLFSMEGQCNDIVLSLTPGYELEDVEPAIQQILKPYGCYRVYGRDEQLSTSVVDMEIEQVGRMSKVIPLLFLFISAVVLYISLSRMIERQRGQIGTMMALGIGSPVIIFHYTLYGTLVGFTGGVLGGILGNAAAGPMADYFRTYFKMPETPTHLSLSYIFAGGFMAAAFCSIISGISAYSIGKLEPADAMSPAAPPTAKKFVLERFPLFMKFFTVTGIMSMRSLSRNKRKSLLSLFGIACAYMITTSLVSMSTLFDTYIFDYLEKTQQQDITVTFQSPVNSSEALSAINHPYVQAAEGIVEVPVSLRSTFGETDCVIQGISPDSVLCQLYGESGRPVTVNDQSLVLSVHTAGILQVSAGDYVEVEVFYPKSRISKVQVSDIIAQYLGSTAYMSLSGVGRISEYQNSFTSVLIQAPEELRDIYVQEFAEAPNVAGVKSRLEIIDQYQSMMGSMTGIMFSMAAMGILIGVAVIYVSSVVSFEEQKREISTMMMLGMSSRQCLDVISIAQWILTVGSLIIGIPMTYGVSYLLTLAIAGQVFSIPPYVSPQSLLIGAGLTFISVILSSAAVHRKLKHMVPVALMQERE